MPRLARPGSRAFRRWILVAVLIGLAVRLAYIIYLHQVGDFLIGDAVMYHGEANMVADGHGWIDPVLFERTGYKRQLAMHPPGYPTYLALWSMLGVSSVLGHQLVTVPIGLLTVVLVGVAGRRFFNERVGIIAALVAAVHPSFWSWDGMVLQESMAILATVFVLLAYHALLRDLNRRTVIVAGLASGFAPLVRAELLIAVVIAAVLVMWRYSLRRALGPISVAALIAIACITPWAIYNTNRFGQFVPLSNGFGITLASTNCPELDGGMLGYWNVHCSNRAVDEVVAEFAAANPDAEEYPVAASTTEFENIRAGGHMILSPEFAHLRFPAFNEAVRDAALRDHTVEWMKAHPKYEARAVVARWGRILGLYRPLQQIRLDTIPDGRKRPVALGAWIGYAALMPFAIAGAVRALRGRKRYETLLLLAPVATVMVTVAITFGNTRYRAIAEPTFVLFAVPAILAVLAWLRRTWGEVYSGEPPPAAG